jgi:hypothetical protein
MHSLSTVRRLIGKFIVFIGHFILIALAIAVPPLFMSMAFDVLPLVVGCFAVLLIGAICIFAGDRVADGRATTASPTRASRHPAAANTLPLYVAGAAEVPFVRRHSERGGTLGRALRARLAPPRDGSFQHLIGALDDVEFPSRQRA